MLNIIPMFVLNLTNYLNSERQGKNIMENRELKIISKPK